MWFLSFACRILVFGVCVLGLGCVVWCCGFGCVGVVGDAGWHRCCGVYFLVLSALG